MVVIWVWARKVMILISHSAMLSSVIHQVGRVVSGSGSGGGCRPS